MNTRSNDNSKPAQAGSAYAFGQLERALSALAQATNAQDMTRHTQKIQSWKNAIRGMEEGVLSVGSRTPVAQTPSWVSLEVLHGGFASGRFLAETPVEEDELRLLQALQIPVMTGREREQLNCFFLTDEGQRRLRGHLNAGNYQIRYPEHGALMVIAWLLSEQPSNPRYQSEAFRLIDELRPWFHRLRFYPYFEVERTTSFNLHGSDVHVASVKEVQTQLKTQPHNVRIEQMNATLTVWLPLYDQLVALWLDTVDGDVLQLDKDRRIVGGHPGAHWPNDWFKRRAKWLADFKDALAHYPLSSRFSKKTSNFMGLKTALENQHSFRTKLSPRTVKTVRRALAHHSFKYGAPDDREQLRSEQYRMGRQPTFWALAQVVANRLESLPEDGGIHDFRLVSQPVQNDEASNISAGTIIPDCVIHKLRRAQQAPIAELIQQKVIRSAEVLASVLPQMTSQVSAAAIENPYLRDLYRRLYRAFRNRRSLLLLNFEKQIRVEECPWIKALQSFAQARLAKRPAIQQAMVEATSLCLSAFPQTILPNPFIREMGELCRKAKLKLPLLEELAADIFMGSFSDKWVLAAKTTSELMKDRLYSRYYDLPAPDFYTGSEPSMKFSALCQQRSSEAHIGQGGFVAQNGAVIEQSQILSAHNLAVLIQELHLTESTRSMAPRWAEDCFRWITHQSRQSNRGNRLHQIKNIAYAWRQGIFFLSFCSPEVQAEQLNRMDTQLRAQPNHLPLEQAIGGLRYVQQGGHFNSKGRNRQGIRLLGWSVGPHWLLN